MSNGVRRSPPGAKRRYHHGDLREALVTAGVELARERGPQGVVVREAARRVGVSHNAAYRHFADREQLLTAIAEHAMALLTAAMEKRLAAVGAGDGDQTRGENGSAGQERARRMLRATGQGYVDFAVDQPGLFRVLFTSFPDGAPVVADPRERSAAGPLDVLTTALDALDAAGAIDPARRPSAELLCWSTVHGFAALYVDGPLKGSADADRDAELEQVLDAIEAALGS